MNKLIDIRAPAEQTEGTRLQVLRWLKAVGDTVADQEPLLELETDKVTVELPSPGAGILRETLKTAQQEVVPGELLGRIEAGVVPLSAPAPTPLPLPLPLPLPPQFGNPVTKSAQALLSPAVKQLLRENGLSPTSIAGTGADGRVTARDVIVHAATCNTAAPAISPATPAQSSRRQAGSQRVPHSLMRKQIAARMVESLLHTAPHVTTVFEADLGAILAHRDRHRDEFARAGIPLTLTAYFIAASAAAIQAVPETNSRWTDEALEVFSHIDIGIATALDGKGLIVPVIRNVSTLDLRGIAAQLTDLTARARNNRLNAEDLRDGTFTISNHGVSGSLVATPIIINQPQSAILGIGKLEKRVVVMETAGGDVIAIRRRCYVSLTVDHRALDGHLANRFLQVFADHLEHWPD